MVGYFRRVQFLRISCALLIKNYWILASDKSRYATKILTHEIVWINSLNQEKLDPRKLSTVWYTIK